MKKSHVLYGASLLTVLGFSACSSDMPDVIGNETIDGDIRYVRVAIANPPSTRADFQAGTAAENAVNTVNFKFYDAAGNPVGETTNVELTFADNTGTPTPNVGAIAEAVVQLTIPRDSQQPAYIMAFINPVDYSEISSTANMQDLRNQTRTSYRASAEAGFAMNNSVYYANDPISGGTNVKMLGTPINADQIFNTQEEAAEAEAAVEIFVERYAAKVNLTLADNGIDDQTVGNYTLKFVPEAWTINADAPTMYASKRFENDETPEHTIPTYDDVQKMLGDWTTWNDVTNHRSYWACSPGYYADAFPTVSDDIIELAKKTGAEYGTGAGVTIPGADGQPVYDLCYYSYNQITSTTSNSRGKGVTAFNNAGQNWKYTMENTMGSAAFNSLNPKAAAPSALIVGHYDVTLNGTAIPVGAGFCTYGDNLYFRGAVPAEATGGKTILDALMDANRILATNEEGTRMTSAAAQNIKDLFEVVHPSADVRGTQSVPHRYVTLQLKSDVTQAQLEGFGLYYKPTGSDTWETIAPTGTQTLDEVITAINRLLWAQIGNARAYNQNKGYYSIPIQHLGMTENTVQQPYDKDGNLDWKKVRVGDFGLVRNHVYSINISEIKGMATGIENLTNPLVPSMEDNNYWIKYSINILNWRIVPTQNVKL